MCRRAHPRKLPPCSATLQELARGEVAAVDADAAEVALEVFLRVPHPRALRADDEMRLIFDTAILEQASH